MKKLRSTTFNTFKNTKVTLKKNARISFNSGLAEILGFLPGDVSEPITSYLTPFDSPFVDERHVDLKLMYILIDLVEPQIVDVKVVPYFE